jgi:hypothetical protein
MKNGGREVIVMRKVIAFLLLFGSSLASAHQPMAHACTPPERPANDQDDVLWQQFMNEIDAFRDCVNDKMKWHEQAAQKHNDNARHVVTLWNDFVQTSLNAPEDFPWPPEQ